MQHNLQQKLDDGSQRIGIMHFVLLLGQYDFVINKIQINE